MSKSSGTACFRSAKLSYKSHKVSFCYNDLSLFSELEETSEREQDDIIAIPKAQASCGGFKKKDIDF